MKVDFDGREAFLNQCLQGRLFHAKLARVVLHAQQSESEPRLGCLNCACDATRLGFDFSRNKKKTNRLTKRPKTPLRAPEGRAGVREATGWPVA